MMVLPIIWSAVSPAPLAANASGIFRTDPRRALARIAATRCSNARTAVEGRAKAHRSRRSARLTPVPDGWLSQAGTAIRSLAEATGDEPPDSVVDEVAIQCWLPTPSLESRHTPQRSPFRPNGLERLVVQTQSATMSETIRFGRFQDRLARTKTCGLLRDFDRSANSWLVQSYGLRPVPARAGR